MADRNNIRKRNVRRTIVEALPSRDKTILLLIKSGFAFSWGFINAVVYVETARFVTMMSGNTLLLAVQTSDWKGAEMAVTATFIGLYVCGGAAYDALSIIYKDRNDAAVNFVAVSATILMGVLADAIKFAMGNCSFDARGYGNESSSDGELCSGHELFFLAPVAFMTGIVTSYLSAHPDGIITNMVTGHMKEPPKPILNRLLRGKWAGTEKGTTGAVVVTTFFLGCLSGSFAVDKIFPLYRSGGFVPAFTVASCVFGALCASHSSLCQQFCFNHELEREMIERLRATLSKHERTTRRTTVDELQRLMMHDIRREHEAEGGNSEGSALTAYTPPLLSE